MTKRRNLASRREGANKSTTGSTGFCPTFTRLGEKWRNPNQLQCILERQRRALHESFSPTFQNSPGGAHSTHSRTQDSPIAQMANLSTAATVLVLGLGFGGFFCFAELRCVDVNLVKGRAPSARVPFPKSMEVEFLHVRPDAETSDWAEMWFVIEEDGEEVAFANVLEYLNNTLYEVILNFKKDGTWGNGKRIKNEDPFNVGTLRRVRLEYSGGLFQAVVWSGDRQKNMTRSIDAPTMGQGNLTVYARSPASGERSFVVFWPRTCSPDCPTTYTLISIEICILVLRVVVVVILLVMLRCLLKARDEPRQGSSGSRERRR